MTTPFEILKKHPVHASIKALLQDNEEKTKEIERTRHVENVLIAENGRLHAEIEKLKAAPTQAQIEAALKEIMLIANGPASTSYADTKRDCVRIFEIARATLAALTTAAEAGYSEPQGTGFQAGEAEPAAAEAGEQTTYGYLLGPGPAIRAKNETIERCAQVAKKFVEECGLEGEQLAAAIRAMKDE